MVLTDLHFVQGYIGDLQRQWYHHEPVIEAAHDLSSAAEKMGLNSHCVALRWALHHSALSSMYGDAIVIGGSSLDQVKANLDACVDGPLPDGLVDLIDGVWAKAKLSPPPAWA